MRFTIRGWLWLCVPLGLLFAVLQRPLRDEQFRSGFLAPWSWLLWLCWREHWAGPRGGDQYRVTSYDVGQLFGAATNLGLAIVLFIVVMETFERLKARGGP